MQGLKQVLSNLHDLDRQLVPKAVAQAVNRVTFARGSTAPKSAVTPGRLSQTATASRSQILLRITAATVRQVVGAEITSGASADSCRLTPVLHDDVRIQHRDTRTPDKSHPVSCPGLLPAGVLWPGHPDTGRSSVSALY